MVTANFGYMNGRRDGDADLTLVLALVLMSGDIVHPPPDLANQSHVYIGDFALPTSSAGQAVIFTISEQYAVVIASLCRICGAHLPGTIIP